jgi:CxxC-x17-CxxC domain-containing protein
MEGRRFGGGFRGPRRDFNSGPREEFDAVCATCKKPCKVPFKPNPDRPVFCRECFMKQKESRPAA